MSFFIGMVIEDPFKIILSSLFYSLVVRKVKEHAFRNSEKYKFMCLKGLESVKIEEDKETLEQLQASGEYKVPNRSLNMLLLEAQEMKQQTSLIIIEFVFYLFITFSSITVALLLYDFNLFQCGHMYSNILFRRPNFYAIRDKKTFWDWMGSSFVDEFYPVGKDPSHTDDHYFKKTRLEGILLRSTPCFKTATSDSFMWAFYPSGVVGFNRGKVCIGFTRASAVAAINNLSAINYLNTKYYFCHVEVLLYSPNLNFAPIVSIKAFIMPGGGIKVWGESYVLKILTFGLKDEGIQTHLFNIFILSLFFLTVITFRNIIYTGVAEFFLSFWNLVDLIVSVFSISFLPSAFFYMYDMETFSNDYIKAEEDIVSEEIIMSRTIFFCMMNTIVVLYTLKGISFLRYNNHMYNFFFYLGSSVPRLIIAILSSLPILLGITLFFHKIFGKLIMYMHTTEYSILYFLLHLVHRSKFENLATYSTFAPFIYCMAVLSYEVIFKNLCTAIMLRSFKTNVVKTSLHDQLYFKALGRVFYRIYDFDFKDAFNRCRIRARRRRRRKVQPV